MGLNSLQQIFKACADDTRLRILNVLNDKSFTVKEICSFLSVSQPTISKHLAKLRMLKMVSDHRVGNQVHYSLNKNYDTPQGRIASFIVSQFKEVFAFKKDKEVMQNLKNESALKGGLDG